MTNDNIARGEALAHSGKYNGATVDAPPDVPAEREAAAAPLSDDYFDFDGAVDYRKKKLRVEREAHRQLDEEEQPQTAMPAVKSLGGLLAEPDPAVAYRIDRLALDGARVLLAAQYKAGKSTAVANLLRSLVDGTPFLGQFDVKIPAKRVALIDNELDESTLRRWLREQGIVNTEAVADVVCLRGQVSAFNLLDPRRRADWSKRFSDLGVDYVALDCLRPVLDALGLDENRDAGRFLGPFDEMLLNAGVSNAAVVQHMGHSGERARGDSRLQDWPDVTWRLVRESEEPDSARFFSAFGRDVNVPEGRLAYDNRRLIYVPGNRSDAKAEAAAADIVTLLCGKDEGLSGAAIEQALSPDHTQVAIRKALAALDKQFLSVVAGARGAKLHSITNPCGKCGKPMTAGQGSAHLSCADFNVEGLF